MCNYHTHTLTLFFIYEIETEFGPLFREHVSVQFSVHWPNLSQRELANTECLREPDWRKHPAHLQISATEKLGVQSG